MASSTLLYIAWPLTLGLSFFAGNMILSKKPTVENSKDGNQPAKFSRTKSSSNGSTTINSVIANHRASSTRLLTGKSSNAEPYGIKEIINTNDTQKRLTELLSMIDQLAPGEFEHVIADCRKFISIETHVKQGKAEYKRLLEAWAKINPERALADAKKNARTTFASETILATWAGYAPDAATQWVKLNHEGDKANPYLVDIIKGSVRNDLGRAIAIFQELSISHHEHYITALDAIQGQVSKLTTKKATAWLATIKDEKHRARATSSLVNTLAKKDPLAAIDWLKSLPVKALNDNAGIVASVLAKEDINEAVKWVSSLKGKIRTDAARQVIKKLVSSDPNKAATWMKTMSGQPGYRPLVEEFMDSTQNDHPVLALANLDQITWNWGRNNRHKQILTSWATKNKGAATQWMQINNVDAATQKKILLNAANNRR